MMLATGLFAQTNQTPLQPPAHRQSALYTRMILVQNAQNLRTIKGLDPKKSLPELLQDYLRQNAVELKSPSTAHFDEKRQTLTIRASKADLDKVETLLVKLREKQ